MFRKGLFNLKVSASRNIEKVEASNLHRNLQVNVETIKPAPQRLKHEISWAVELQCKSTEGCPSKVRATIGSSSWVRGDRRPHHWRRAAEDTHSQACVTEGHNSNVRDGRNVIIKLANFRCCSQPKHFLLHLPIATLSLFIGTQAG